MSLDGAFLSIVRQELIRDGIIGSRLDKVHQPARDELMLSLRTRTGAVKLSLSCDPSSARVCVTRAESDNPQSPPMFCMLLRKYLGGGKLTEIAQDGLERVIMFGFECVNEIGDIVNNRLCVELIGRSANIILLTQKEGDWRVVDAMKRIGDDISAARRILPNIIYEAPPKEDRLDIRFCEASEARERLLELPEQKLEKALIKTFEGISPIICREIAFYTARDVDCPCKCLSDNDKFQRFSFFIGKIRAALCENSARFFILSDKNGKPFDFTFINTEQYGIAAVQKEYESASALLDAFFSGRARAERMKQRSGDLLKAILAIYNRTAKKIELQKEELAACADREQLRIKGDLVSANIYRMQKGMDKITVENYITGQEETVLLDVRLTPPQNAQKFYGEYRKLDTAEKMLTKLIEKEKKELIYLDSVFDAAARAQTEAELQEIRYELTQSDYLKKGRDMRSEKEAKPLRPLKFRSSDGFDIFVGRNNLQNDRLTLKTADGNDMWLHTKDIPGAHVIISAEGKDIPDNTIEEAARLAVDNSKAKGSTRIPVDYTRVKFVKKPKGAKPGMVTFTNNKTIIVDSSES